MKIDWKLTGEETEILLKLIGRTIGADKFTVKDLDDILHLASGMFWSKDLDTRIRELANLVRSEFERPELS